MSFLFIITLFSTAARSLTVSRGALSNGWAGNDFKSLVTFGDSYTDEKRAGYFADNNGAAPPVGWIQPVVWPPLSLIFVIWLFGLSTTVKPTIRVSFVLIEHRISFHLLPNAPHV